MRTLTRSFWIAALLAMPALADDWGHLGRDDGRRRLPAEAVLSPAPLAYFTIGGSAVVAPVAADGFLVAATLDGDVRAFRESDGTPLWTVHPGGPIRSTPLVDRGRVVVSTGDGRLEVYRLADGASLWSLVLGASETSSPILSGDTLYVGGGFASPGLIAVGMSTRSVLWTAPFTQVTQQSPALGNGRVLLGDNTGSLQAIDPASGQAAWTLPVGGTGGPSSPLVDGTSIFLVTDGLFQRVDADPSAWAASNWTVPLADPAPVAGAMGLEWASSSPAMAGSLVAFVARFTYAMDDDGDGGADRRVLREFACAVDPATRTLAWQRLLGTASTADLNGIPPSLLCPSPVSTGPGIAVASSVAATLRVLSPADGSDLASFSLDAPCLASPMVANARLYALSTAGTLHVYEGTKLQPPSATGLDPDGIQVASTPASLTWNASAPGSTYVVRIARDGEVLMDWDHEFLVGTNSVAPPALLDGFYHTWAVRVRSADGAYAPWTVATFAQAGPVSPPGSLTATPQLRKVALSWTASPSPAVAFYRLTYGATTVDLGPVTSTVVSGLTALTSYTFEVRAVDHLGHASLPVTASATPLTSITIAGIPYATIAAALAAAQPGDVVEIGQDVLQVTATLQIPAGVTLRGAGALGTRLEASGPIVLIDALQGSAVQGLSLSGGLIGVRASGSDVTIRNLVIRDMADAGVDVAGSADVINNTIVGNAVAGVRSSGLATVRNNIVQQNGVGLSGIILSSYNLVNDGYSVCVPGVGDLNALVAFLDPATGDYREQPGQFSLDSGSPSDDFSLEPGLNGGRINMGAFGNTALAATSLTSGTTKPPRSSGGCGLTGLEVLLLLALLRRRR